MRQLVNAYADHLDRLMNGDSFDAVKGFAELLVILAGVVVVVVVLLVGLLALASGPQQHGSCRVQHWAGKSYVCDEYYPLPTTEP